MFYGRARKKNIEIVTGVSRFAKLTITNPQYPLSSRPSDSQDNTYYATFMNTWIECWHKPNLTFHIEWVPGHMDIHGNDTADEEAKRAAKEKIQGDNPFNIHKLKSSQNMTINASIAKATKTAWSSRNTKNKQARQHTRPQRIKTGEQLYNPLTRKQGATLIQLRTEHCRLNKYLHKFSIVDDRHCACGHGIESVKHFLLSCGTYAKERKELREKIGWRNMRLHTLLGNPKVVRHTLEYVEKTGRFEFRN